MRDPAPNDAKPPGPTALLTLTDVCILLQVEPKYVYRLVHERRIPYLKLGRYLRFDAVELASWLQAARRPAIADGSEACRAWGSGAGGRRRTD